MPADRPPRPRGIERLFVAPRLALLAFRLVMETNAPLCWTMLFLALASGVLPAAMTYTGKRILDEIGAAQASNAGASSALGGVALLFAFAAALVVVHRGLAVADALLRVQLAQRVTELVLKKAIGLGPEDFDDPSLADKLARVQQQAAERPLGFVRRVLATFEQVCSVAGFALIVATFSGFLPWFLILAAVPAVAIELKFNADAFQLFKRRSPAARRQAYLEHALTRLDHVKESHLFGSAPLFLERHRRIFDGLYSAERSLTLRRGLIGILLGLLGSLALVAGYAWVTWSGAGGHVSLGDVALLFIALRQVQSGAADTVILLAGLHEDHLYLSDLGSFLARAPLRAVGVLQAGTTPGDGLRFEDVWFTYPDSDDPALQGVSFHLPQGTTLAVVGRNGAGKSTLLQLALGLRTPTRGRVLFDGVDLREWTPEAYHARVAVVFQDFVRYQLLAGENIGVADVASFGDEARWAEAARASSAGDFLAKLPAGYYTQLGRWFDAGHELSAGEWQRVALARLFLRRAAELLILDEPTSNLDTETEAHVVERLREALAGRSGLVVSHRPAAVALADRVLRLEGGRVVDSVAEP